MGRTLIVFQTLNLRWVLPIVLAFLFSLGDTVAANDGALHWGATFFLKLMFFSVLFLLAFFIADKTLTRLSKRRSPNPPRPLTSVMAFLFCNNKTAGILKLWVMIIVCWIPWLIALHPGVFWSDTSQQLLEHYGLVTLSDHHPYMTTLALGLFADIGELLFGSVSRGLFVLVILQCLIASLYFARFAYKLSETNDHPVVPLGITLFVGLFPFIPFMFCSLAKDTISASLFIGVCFNIFDILNNNENKKPSVGQVLELTIVSTLCSLTKKTAGYIVVASLLVLVVLYLRNKAKRSLIAPLLITFVVTFLVFPKIILPAAEVIPGGKQEVVAVAIQQIAHDVKYNEDSLDDDDKKLIAGFLPIAYEDISDNYDWQIVDPIKQRSLRNEALLSDFLQLWAKQSISNPAGHLEAWVGLISGWLSFRTDSDCTPNYMVVCSYSGWHDEGIENVTDWNDQLTRGGKAAETFYKTIQSAPLINVLFLRSTWATIIPFFMLFYLMGQCKGHRSKGLVLLAPILLSMLTLAITPVSIMGGEPTRYIFAMVCTAPFLLFGVDPTCETTTQLQSSKPSAT